MALCHMKGKVGAYVEHRIHTIKISLYLSGSANVNAENSRVLLIIEAALFGDAIIDIMISFNTYLRCASFTLHCHFFWLV